MIDLKEVAGEINEILEKRRREIGLSFIEEGYIYYIKIFIEFTDNRRNR